MGNTNHSKKNYMEIAAMSSEEAENIKKKNLIKQKF